MTASSSDIELARVLWQARHDGTRVSDGPSSLDEVQAYAVQEALIEIHGGEPSGWKAGATAAGAPEALGLSGPMAGPLWDDFIHHFDEVSPRLQLSFDHTPQAEVELAFRFGSTPQSSQRKDILDAIDGAAIAIEITGRRFGRALTPPGPGLVADHASNAAVICGRFSHGWRGVELSDLAPILKINGEPAAEGSGKAVLGSPLNALLWLVEHLQRRGIELRPDQIVMSGAMISLTDFPAGALLEAECAPLGRVSAIIEDMAS